MNIESSTINRTNSAQNQKTAATNFNSSVKFADELKDLKETSKTEEKEEKPVEKNENKSDTSAAKSEENDEKDLDKAIEGLNSVVEELNQSDENSDNNVKNKENQTDKNNMINNEFNINENKDLLPQMNPNMNFSGDGQPFSSFMNNNDNNRSNQPELSAKNLAEEAEILSTMAENISIANKNGLFEQHEDDIKTVTREDGVVRVNTNTNVTIETVVKFDSVIMNQADVEVFANLVNNVDVNMSNLAPEALQKSINVSKTLADMLAKSMENNQPLRIDFDNNISVIIRISRDGKLSADFLPSSQVAEAYLKENLPLLKQRFDENNIEYEELNQRERREKQEDQNRKKDSKDER